MTVNVVSDKKTNRIRDQLQEEIEKLREEREVPEMLDLLRQIERANEKLKNPAGSNHARTSAGPSVARLASPARRFHSRPWHRWYTQQ